MPSKSRTAFGAALCVAAVAALGGCNNASRNSAASANANEIVIGEYLSLTGTKADFGITTGNGAQLAADEINAAGGVLGKKIRLLPRDDQGVADQVGTIVTGFVSSDHVDLVLGEVASKLSMRAGPVCEKAATPMITPSSTNPEVTVDKSGNVRKYVFRVCFTDPFQGGVLARFAAGNLHAKKAAVLRDVSNDYSVGLADYFVQEFKRLGGTVTVDKSCAEGDDNFRPQLTAIAATHPDVVVAPVYYREIDLIARQARDAGIKVPLMGGDGWDSPTVVQNAAGALEGCYMTNHYSEAQGGPVIGKFVAAYQRKFNAKPNALAALGYDAVNIYADAIKRAGSTDREKVTSALAATRDFPAVTGHITIDPQHNAVKDAVILQVKGGKFVYVTTVKP